MKPSEDWSRGESLGESVSGSVGLAVESSGERIHLTWPYETDSGVRIRYQQLNSEGEITIDRQLELPLERLKKTRVSLAKNGQLHLFWVSRPSAENNWQLWHSLLGSDGHLSGVPSPLSTSGVGDYVIARDNSGGVFISWDDSRGEVFVAHYDQVGKVDIEPVLISAMGESPAVGVDSMNRLHLVWREGTHLVFARYLNTDLDTVEITQIAELKVGSSDSMVGPELGFSDGWVYVFWSIFRRTGEEAGTASTEFVAFTAEAPKTSPSTRLLILPAGDQPYLAYQGYYPLTRLVSPTTFQFSSDIIYQPTVIHGQRAELAMAVAVNQQFRLDYIVQVAVGIFEDGQFKGYQMAAKTKSLSREPILVADSKGQLHLVWREGAKGDRVYYATTAPTARKRLDRLAFNDMVNAVLEGGMEMLTAVLLFPLAIPWMLPGLVLMGIWKIKNDQESLADPTSLILMVIAVLLFQGTKLLFLPSIIEYVPFSAWLEVPTGWRLPLRISVPLMIFGLSLLVADLVRRRRTNSSLVFYFVLTLTDTILSLAVYGVIFLGFY